ncbi:MAG: hypothetical protein JXA52_03375, partial [Planctomycetes bacterium]|nr:hypothetical protein [Planctomycetota bacterium]
MRLLTLSLICCALITSLAPRAGAGEGHNFRLLSGPEIVRRFELVEIDFTCEGVPHFDSKEKRLDAVILPPVGNKQVVPVYWTQEFDRSLEVITEKNGRGAQVTRQVEKIKPLPGEIPHWRLRYCPSRVGTYQVELRLVSPKN